MKIMGILNVTPDSFHPDSRVAGVESAVRKAEAMWAEGAEIIDIGAESTRPGAVRISPGEERARLSDIVRTLADRGMTVSVDTVNSSTAAWAIAAGAAIINDISGGMNDPQMASVVADSDAQMVVQHWRGFPSDPSLNLAYQGIGQVLTETLEQVERVQSAGVPPERVVIDPGLGFALDSEDSWRVLDVLGCWVKTGYPVLVGASRKRFVRERYEALEGTLLVTKMAAAAGAWAVRVHDVAANVEVACGKQRISSHSEDSPR